MMKRSVKLDLSWRVWSLIVGFLVLVGFVGLSFAYNANGVGGNPAIMGHSADEISGLPNFTSMDYVVDSWHASDGSSWYRKYKSGWIEQGGNCAFGTIVFPKNFTSLSYTFVAIPNHVSYYGGHIWALGFKDKSLNSIYFSMDQAGYSTICMWQAEGY